MGLLLGLLGCQQANGGSTGGETHFLKLCSTEGDSETCGSELTCLCNVCTRPCDADTACSAFPGAVCAPSGTTLGCPQTMAAAVCDLECVGDSECRALSDQHRCIDGACRRGAVEDGEPAPQDAQVVDGGRQDSPGEPALCPASDVDANEVLIIGDSFFAATHEITGFLEELARQAGALSTGERYRDASRLIDNALALMGNGIASQYAGAVAEGPVRVVIMNGGGADALLGTCDVPDASCPVVVQAVAAADELLQTMADDAVSDVVYVAYPDPLDDETKVIYDAMRPQLQEVCAAARTRCHWLDLRPTFEGNYDEYIRAGGLNPTSAGAQAVASEIWDVMQLHCIAQ